MIYVTAGHSSGSKMKLLEQPIPASFLQLEERVRILATNLKQDAEPPLLKENRFREETNDIIANPRELDQAVTFLHENGVCVCVCIVSMTTIINRGMCEERELNSTHQHPQPYSAHTHTPSTMHHYHRWSCTCTTHTSIHCLRSGLTRTAVI